MTNEERAVIGVGMRDKLKLLEQLLIKLACNGLVDDFDVREYKEYREHWEYRFVHGDFDDEFIRDFLIDVYYQAKHVFNASYKSRALKDFYSQVLTSICMTDERARKLNKEKWQGKLTKKAAC